MCCGGNKGCAHGGRLSSLPIPPPAPQSRGLPDEARRAHDGSIVRALTVAGIPCPSAADPDANQHRLTKAWTVRTVQEILANPAYTGRMVWDRQRTERVLVNPANPGFVHRRVRVWKPRRLSVLSDKPASETRNAPIRQLVEVSRNLRNVILRNPVRHARFDQPSSFRTQIRPHRVRCWSVGARAVALWRPTLRPHSERSCGRPP